MPEIKILAPAKLNLDLQIGEKQLDGFHGIKSIFLALDYGDIIKMKISPSEHEKPCIEIKMNWHISNPGGIPEDIPEIPEIPIEENLVFRAISQFKSYTSCDFSVFAEIDKHLPPGGGLGGGSSDAASTLMALNKLVSTEKTPLKKEELIEIGSSLGSDVPFFLLNTTAAFVSGRGEKVKALRLPNSFYKLSFLLVNPGIPCNTASVYNLLDNWRHEKNFIQNDRLFTPEQLLQVFSASPSTWPFYNDFLPLFQADNNYIKIFESLKSLGAEFSGLSGSGSTCFGVFTDYKKALKAKKILSKQWPLAVLTSVAATIQFV